MRKKVILTVVLVVFTLTPLFRSGQVMAEELSVERQAAIKANCDKIKDNLKALQRQDSKARVYLGRYYEVLLSRFIMPLNMRLVENNLSSTSFINNQNNFNMVRSDFVNSYVEYQKVLEELVGIDCKSNPTRFYEELLIVREKRAKVASDTTKLRDLADRHIELVTELKEKV